MSENQYRKNTFHALVGYVLLFISLNARYDPPRNIFKKYSTAHLLYNIYGHRCFFVFYSQTKINFSVKMTKRNRTNAGLKVTEIMFCVGHIENKLTSKWVMFYRYRSILLH